MTTEAIGSVHSQIWRGLLESGRLARYYGHLAERYSRYSRLSLMGLAVASIATAGISFLNLPSWAAWAAVLIPLLVAAAAIAMSYLDYSRRAGIAASIASLCIEAERDWESLWWDMYAQDAIERAQALARRVDVYTATALHQHGFYDAKLNERYNEETNEFWTKALSNREGVSSAV